MTLSPPDIAKSAAAARALEFVEDGMRLGLGSGSTAARFVEALGARVAQGLKVRCVATSSATERLAAEAGLDLVAIETVGALDLTVDGADELDADLSMIKGGGAALLREKIVAAASARFVIVADASKRVARLGAFPLPVEAVRFGWPVTQAAIEAALAPMDLGGRRVAVRMADGAPLLTDEGHVLLDLHLGRIGDARALAAALSAIPGVVEHGLFLGMAERALIGHPDGRVEEVQPRAFAREDYVVAAMRDVDA